MIIDQRKEQPAQEVLLEIQGNINKISELCEEVERLSKELMHELRDDIQSKINNLLTNIL